MSDNPFAPPAAAPPELERNAFRLLKRPAAGTSALILTSLVLFLCGEAVRLFGTADQTYVFFALLGFSPETFLTGLVWTPLTFQFAQDELPALLYPALLIFAFGTDVERRVNRPVMMFVFFLLTGLVTAAGLTGMVYLEYLNVGPHIGMLPFACALGVLFVFQSGRFFIGPLPVWPLALFLMLPALVLPAFAPFGWGGVLGGLTSQVLFAVRGQASPS